MSSKSRFCLEEMKRKSRPKILHYLLLFLGKEMDVRRVIVGTQSSYSSKKNCKSFNTKAACPKENLKCIFGNLKTLAISCITFVWPVHRVSRCSTLLQYRPGQDFHLQLGKLTSRRGCYIRPNQTRILVQYDIFLPTLVKVSECTSSQSRVVACNTYLENLKPQL